MKTLVRAASDIGAQSLQEIRWLGCSPWSSRLSFSPFRAGAEGHRVPISAASVV